MPRLTEKAVICIAKVETGPTPGRRCTGSCAGKSLGSGLCHRHRKTVAYYLSVWGAEALEVFAGKGLENVSPSVKSDLKQHLASLRREKQREKHVADQHQRLRPHHLQPSPGGWCHATTDASGCIS